jgi:DNA-binding NtrC family response regulator
MNFIKDGSTKISSPHRTQELKDVRSMDKPIPILIVSSEFKNRHALREILNREGWKTICASTVGECEEVFANHNIDLVFCDRGLTDGTYRDIVALSRSRSRGVRLVVTSRLADWDEYLEALHEGVFDLIASPSQTAEIVRVINQAQREDQMPGTTVAAGKAVIASRET